MVSWLESIQRKCSSNTTSASVHQLWPRRYAKRHTLSVFTIEFPSLRMRMMTNWRVCFRCTSFTVQTAREDVSFGKFYFYGNINQNLNILVTFVCSSLAKRDIWKLTLRTSRNSTRCRSWWLSMWVQHWRLHSIQLLKAIIFFFWTGYLRVIFEQHGTVSTRKSGHCQLRIRSPGQERQMQKWIKKRWWWWWWRDVFLEIMQGIKHSKTDYYIHTFARLFCLFSHCLM